ncbi:MAG: type II toxin-antitoxin system PemK/MazF family toxin [Actinobacteria bacterium]|nr:type II toxin-antitoxin system PemK/MazF family toxin [Actinomycetota bacterium]
MNAGDVVDVDFGTPLGSETGFIRPAVVVSADAFLRYRPTTVFVVPLTSTPRSFPSHIEISPDAHNGLHVASCALVEQMRAVATERCGPATGNVGSLVIHQILDVLSMVVGMP